MTTNSRYAEDIALPFRFDENCDLAMDSDEAVIEQAINLITFTPRGTVILFNNFGSSLEDSVFDQLDDETELNLDLSIREAIEKFEDRVVLDREFIFDESADSRKLIIIVPYHNELTNKLEAVKLVVQRPIGE